MKLETLISALRNAERLIGLIAGVKGLQFDALKIRQADKFAATIIGKFNKAKEGAKDER